MILNYDKRPEATVDQKVQSLMESTQLALNDISRAQETADVAKEDAQTSVALAETARTAANEASDSARIAKQAADEATAAVEEIEGDVSGLTTRVAQAETDIDATEGSIVALGTRVGTAETNIINIEGNVTSLTGRVSDAEDDINAVEGDITSLQSDVSTAQGNITTIQGNLTSLTGRVSVAEGDITTVEGNITSLQGRVSDAEDDVDATLRALGVAESVIDTINWIAEHGSMESQAGKTFDANNIYFIVDPNGDYTVGGTRYSVVENPVASDIANYYMLSAEGSIHNYVSTHVVVDSEGLWIIPDAGGNKVLIATGQGSTYTSAGTYIIGKVNGVDAVLAQFTKDGVQIGQTSESHLEMDYHSMQLIDKEGNTYFHVSDLRDASGKAEIVETIYGDGDTVSFDLSFLATGTDYSVTVNGVEATNVTKKVVSVVFTTAPSAGDIIVFTYDTKNNKVKALTFGGRRSGTIGALSTACGQRVLASNYASHAEGSETTASGYASHAEGYDTTASGTDSHAEGISTTASGYASHAEGRSTTASGYYSHTEGYSTTASGYYSHAQNYYTTAGYTSQTAIGKYNDNQSNNVFEIGNGTDDNNRSNAFTVDWDGNVDASGDVTDGSGNVLADKADTTDLDDYVKYSDIFDLLYPVGSYYETSDTSFNPNTAWGGTWVLETAGMVHVSAGTGYSVSGANQSDGVGAKDGGEATHVLTPNETAMKNHSHTINHGHGDNISFSVNKSVQNADSITGGGHKHTVTTKYQASFASGNRNGFMNNGTGGSTTSMAIIADNTGTHTHSVPQHSHTLTKSGGVTDYSGSSGGQTEVNGIAHENMQPYINVNRWHRTA